MGNCVTDLVCKRCAATFRGESDRRYCSRACFTNKGHAEPPPVAGCRWIELGGGAFVIVDVADYELLSEREWYLHGKGRHRYAASGAARGFSAVLMHRFIMKPAPHELIDHVSLDGLDNRRANLRVANRSTNLSNGRKFRGASKYRGVSLNARNGRWYADIAADAVRHRLGSYTDEEHAARVYDEAARRLHGEFARLNFPANEERNARVL